MRTRRNDYRTFFLGGFVLALLIFPSSPASAAYPEQPITVYCGYAAGATTDLTARALADGAEKLLGVPVIVENKPGGGATVATALVASKKPDGYTLGVVSTGVLTVRPHMLKIGYDPDKDITVIMQYSRYIGGLCVLADSPFKTIDQFIAHAKANPGLSYGSSGLYTQQQLAVELLAQCKGLTFKHVPFKGGAPANTALLGKHTDFVAGAGQHIQYLKQEKFRMLLVYNAEKRDPAYPDIPILKELGCEDAPALGYILVAPSGMPNDVYQKISTTFKKAAESEAFQKLLTNLNLPYDFKAREEMEKEIPVQSKFYEAFLKKMGAKKK